MEKTTAELRSIPEEEFKRRFQKVAEAPGKVCALSRGVF